MRVGVREVGVRGAPGDGLGGSTVGGAGGVRVVVAVGGGVRHMPGVGVRVGRAAETLRAVAGGEVNGVARVWGGGSGHGHVGQAALEHDAGVDGVAVGVLDEDVGGLDGVEVARGCNCGHGRLS